MIKRKISNITFSALFTAIIFFLSQISFLTPTVPITLQVLGVALCGYTLSLKWSLSCVATYIVIGAFGLPVFSAFQGGVQVILGPNGGFIFGFLILVLFCGLTKKTESILLKVVLSALGLAFCHLTGILQYSFVSGNKILISFLTASLPFLVKDILLMILAYLMSTFVINRLKELKS